MPGSYQKGFVLKNAFSLWSVVVGDEGAGFESS